MIEARVSTAFGRSERRRNASRRSSRSSASRPSETNDSRTASDMLSPIQSRFVGLFLEFDPLAKGRTSTVSARSMFAVETIKNKTPSRCIYSQCSNGHRGFRALLHPDPGFDSCRLVQHQLQVGAAHADLFDCVLAIGVSVPHGGGGVLAIARLDLDSRLGGLAAVLDHDLLVLQLELVVSGFQFRAADRGRLKQRYGEPLGAGEGHAGQQTCE